MRQPKLSKAQAELLQELKNAKIDSPENILHGQVFQVPEKWVHPEYPRISYEPGFIYGRFNSQSIRALEKKGIIKIHVDGGQWQDKIELL